MRSVEEAVYVTYGNFIIIMLELLYFITLATIYKDLSKAANPSKTKDKAENWIYGKYEEDEEKNIK